MSRRPVCRSVRCACGKGKAKYYTEDAAAHALRIKQGYGRVDPRRQECRYYPCDLDDGVWHLTSMTVAQFERRRRLWTISTIAQWAAPVDYTLKVKPGCRLNNPNVVRVTWKVSS